MKKIILFTAMILCLKVAQAQITFDNSYPVAGGLYLDKFHISGYKYVKANIQALTINVYNVNHTLFKTISIPTQSSQIMSISYLSENLFDLDSLMEFALITAQSGPSPGAVLNRFYIYKEDGTQMMFRDSATFIYSTGADIFYNYESIFYDGINTKMRLACQGSGGQSATQYEIYTLPGSIPCSDCGKWSMGSGVSGSGTTGISSPGNTQGGSPLFYPNPVTDQLKLKYDLPKNYKNAEIKIFDAHGKQIEVLKVTDDFNFIYLPSNYNNGLYLYSLIVDGKLVKTEKIILNK